MKSALLLGVGSALLLAPSFAHADEEATQSEEPPAWPERIGPFELSTEDRAASVRLGFAAQLRLTVEDREIDGDATRDTSADLAFPRIRPGLRASFLDDRIESGLQLNLSPGQLELIDLFVDATLLPELRLRAGQFKTPFTLYRQQSFTELATTDWPLTTRWFGAERQLGLMAHDTRRDLAGFSYAVGAFGGQNRRAAHARELPRVYGEEPGNPSDLSDPSVGDLHLELVGRVAHAASDVHPETNFDVSGQPVVRHAVALSAAWDTDPVYRQDMLVRVAPELMLKWNGFSWIAIAYLGLSETLDDSVILAAVGGFTEIGWQPDPHLQIAIRYARVHLLADLRADARAYAASIEPADPALHDAWAAQYGGVGHVRARHELALGVTVPIIGRSLAWQSDIGWLRTERDDGERDDVQFRTQLQLAF